MRAKEENKNNQQNRRGRGSTGLVKKGNVEKT